MPCNLASVLYNKMKETGGVEVAAINTLGVLYIVTTGDGITSVADLAGKTIYSTGKGTTPEYTLNYILEQNGLAPGEDVTVEYKSEATEGAERHANVQRVPPLPCCPKPYVTTAQMQMEGPSVALDMTEEWNKVSPDSALRHRRGAGAHAVCGRERGGLCRVSGRLCGQCRVCKRQHAGRGLVAQYGIVPKAEVAEKALPACNITFITGADMKAKVSGYLNVLYEQNAQAVGGQMPGDDFYYGA